MGIASLVVECTASSEMNPIIPKALRATTSVNLADAHQRSTRLYRHMLRSVPQILSDYKMTNVPVSHLRDRMATEFRAASSMNGSNIERIDRGIFGASQELEETLMMWKTPTHVYRYLEVEGKYGQRGGESNNSTFLDKFYNNTMNTY